VKGVPSPRVASGIVGYVEELLSEKMVRGAASSAAPSCRPWKCSAYPEAGEEDVEEVRRGRGRRRRKRRRKGGGGSGGGLIGSETRDWAGAVRAGQFDTSLFV